MSRPAPTDAHRAAAWADYRTAFQALSRVFDLDPDRPAQAYRFDGSVRARAMRALIDLTALYDHGRIEPHPEHPDNQRAQAARADAVLQAVIRRASDRAPIRGPGRAPAEPRREAPARRGS